MKFASPLIPFQVPLHNSPEIRPNFGPLPHCNSVVDISCYTSHRGTCSETPHILFKVCHNFKHIMSNSRIPFELPPKFQIPSFPTTPLSCGCPHDLRVHSMAHVGVIPELPKFFEPLIFFAPTSGASDYFQPQFNYGISPVHILWGTHLGSTDPTFKNSPFFYRLTLLQVSAMRTLWSEQGVM